MSILHHVRYGSGQPIVFLGSIASTLEMWEPQLNGLSAGAEVIAIDHRGHGGSPVIPGPCTLADLAADVLETLDHLDIKRFSVVGLSLGGAVAQHLATHTDRVERAALLCTAPKFGQRSTWLEREELTRTQGIGPMVEAILGLWLSEAFTAQNPATVDRMRRMIASTPGEAYAACAAALAEFDRTDSPTLPVPTLTIAGAEDRSTPPATVAQLGGEHVVVPGAHVPTVESPEAITHALSHFLEVSL
ncbi:alpha/beta fold hydrolase [Corynebacterium uropygiale]|uniref:Alpha/beta fold hydrolase n=1 Tax=Corynebacterium uropygiale TaxID=1775911 RepID=A0A9X1QSC8_9CORY|nr:alpha/beta fold hydrolase [Corynebacterium uropygiale]MCF4007502.1 alpha/beta fold hydrolase [Corynebacterium uropygiale]